MYPNLPKRPVVPVKNGVNVPKPRLPSTPAFRPFNFDDTDDFTQSPSTFPQTPESPNASLFNATAQSETVQPDFNELSEVNESTSDTGEVETGDSQNDENIFHWDGVTMTKQTVFKAEF